MRPPRRYECILTPFKRAPLRVRGGCMQAYAATWSWAYRKIKKLNPLCVISHPRWVRPVQR